MKKDLTVLAVLLTIAIGLLTIVSCGPVSIPGEKGEQGEPGADGKDGIGIVSIEKTSSDGLMDTYTILYSDGSKSVFSVQNGADGEQGEPGQPGRNGADGRDGVDGKDGKDGLNGEAADKGEPGVGIESISKTDSNGVIDTYTITLTDNTTYTFTITNGVDGVSDIPGPQGEKGDSGVGIIAVSKTATNGNIDTYTITFSNEQIFTFDITNGTNGMPGIPGPQGEKGEKGDTGAQGEKGDMGVGIKSVAKTAEGGNTDTYTITLTNGQTYTFDIINGTDGAPGSQGEKGEKGDTGAQGEKGEKGDAGVGIKSITKTGTNGKVDTYTITLTNGQTSTFDITNGADGVSNIPGPQGAQGEKGEKGDTGAQGEKGEKGDAGVQGIPGNDGKDGETPFIGTNGNWWIGTKDTGVKAAGQQGASGGNGKDGTNGKSAFELYKDLFGYNGSEQQWLCDLVSGRLASVPDSMGKYVLTFNTDGGSYIMPQSVKIGELPVKPADPTKAGVLFEGWYTDNTYMRHFTFNAPLTKNTTVYAKYHTKSDVANITYIHTVDELRNIVQDDPNVYYQLANDIDLDYIEWTPLAHFKGTLDGADHCIRNFYLNGNKQDAGFILTNEGTVSNIKFDNVIVMNIDSGSCGLFVTNNGIVESVVIEGYSLSSSYSDYTQCNGLERSCGILASCNTGTLSNCTVINGNVTLCGLIYQPAYQIYCDLVYYGCVCNNYGVIQDCCCSSIVHLVKSVGCSSPDPEIRIGGLCCDNFDEGIILGCHAATDIIAAYSDFKSIQIGGLVNRNFGEIGGSTACLSSDCAQYKDPDYYHVAGFAYSNESTGTIFECKTELSANGAMRAGGFAYSSNGIVKNCYSEVEINDCTLFGGFAFVTKSGSRISNCYTVGNSNLKLWQSWQEIGGFVARACGYQNSYISNCYSNININVDKYRSINYFVDGFVGLAETEDVYMNNYVDSAQSITVAGIPYDSNNRYVDVIESTALQNNSVLKWSTDIWYFETGQSPKLLWELE